MSSSADSQLAKRLRREAKAAARAQAAREAAVRRGEAKRRAARRRLPAAAAVAVVATGSNVLLYGAEGTPLLWLLAGVATVRAGSAVARLRRPVAGAGGLALPAAAVPMPPAAGSAAFPAVRRLEVVREELRRLLPLVAPAGREAGEEAWRAAHEADTALRWQAARLAAVEPHRGVDPYLLRTLEDGVGCQERLVGAVADLVAASADPLAGSRLQDATDALHGLAAGLRELR